MPKSKNQISGEKTARKIKVQNVKADSTPAQAKEFFDLKVYEKKGYAVGLKKFYFPEDPQKICELSVTGNPTAIQEFGRQIERQLGIKGKVPKGTPKLENTVQVRGNFDQLSARQTRQLKFDWSTDLLIETKFFRQRSRPAQKKTGGYSYPSGGFEISVSPNSTKYHKIEDPERDGFSCSMTAKGGQPKFTIHTGWVKSVKEILIEVTSGDGNVDKYTFDGNLSGASDTPIS